MKKLNAGFVHPEILIVVAIVGFIVAVFIGNNPLSPSILPPSPTPVATESSVENWKTYRNEEYGFSLKYPADLNINTQDNDIYLFFISFFDPDNLDRTISVTVRGANLKEQILFEEWAASHTLIELDNRKDLIFQNFPATRLDYVPTSGSGNKPTSALIVNNGKYSYSISSHPDTLTQILSTFEFLDKSYADESIDYSCNTDSDCVKQSTCSEDCVNSSWLKDYPYTGPACGIPWQFGCKCVDSKCISG